MEEGCKKWALRFIVGTLLMLASLIIIVLIIVAIEGGEDEPIVDCGYLGPQKQSVCEYWND